MTHATPQPDERVRAYAEAIGLANNAETRHAAALRCVAVEDRHTAALLARAAKAEAERAVADAEQAALRAEVEQLRILVADKIAWRTKAERAGASAAGLLENLEGVVARAEAAEAKVARVEAALARVESLAKLQATSCRALHRADDERNWLDVLAIIERAALAGPAEPAPTEGGA